MFSANHFWFHLGVDAKLYAQKRIYIRKLAPFILGYNLA